MTFHSSYLVVVVVLILSNWSCHSTPDFIPVPSAETTVFAVIGDYGDQGNPAEKVANMVKSWNPEFIITVGDNNYNNGELETIPQNISQYYDDYIYNPDAPVAYQCLGLASDNQNNLFFPSPGNHDYYADNLASYLRFFTLPDMERNYDFVRGTVHFFSIDSNRKEEFEQTKLWLQEKIAASEMPFKIVYFHHPPYSSSKHGSETAMQWAFADWGVDVVISGHEHIYQHIINKNEPEVHYFVNGLGGRKKQYGCAENPLNDADFDTFCYNKNYGAMRVAATPTELLLAFYSIKGGGRLINEVVIEK